MIMIVNKQHLFFCIIILAIAFVGCNKPNTYSHSITPSIDISLTPKIYETIISTLTIEPPTQTPTLKIPDPIIAPEAEKKKAREILQVYYSRIPFFSSVTTDIYQEMHGCTGTNNVQGFLNFDVLHSFQTVKESFKKYFHSEGWEFLEENYDVDHPWARYKASRTLDNEKPIKEYLYVDVYDLTYPDSINQVRTKVWLHILHVENGSANFIYNCESGWWLWIGP